MTGHGAYDAIGRLVRQARLDQGISRRGLVRRIVECRSLEVTRAGADFMLRELEVDGLVMNIGLLMRILDLLAIPITDVADLLAQAKIASDAAFAADLKRCARSMAVDQGRLVNDVFTGLAKVYVTQNGRPMT